MKHELNKKVKVVKCIDETGTTEYIGEEGIVIEHNDNGATGNTIDDPLHVVLFLDKSKESFWYEELQDITGIKQKNNHIK